MQIIKPVIKPPTMILESTKDGQGSGLTTVISSTNEAIVPEVTLIGGSYRNRWEYNMFTQADGTPYTGTVEVIVTGERIRAGTTFHIGSATYNFTGTDITLNPTTPATTDATWDSWTNSPFGAEGLQRYFAGRISYTNDGQFLKKTFVENEVDPLDGREFRNDNAINIIIQFKLNRRTRYNLNEGLSASVTIGSTYSDNAQEALQLEQNTDWYTDNQIYRKIRGGGISFAKALIVDVDNDWLMITTGVNETIAGVVQKTWKLSDLVEVNDGTSTGLYDPYVYTDNPIETAPQRTPYGTGFNTDGSGNYTIEIDKGDTTSATGKALIMGGTWGQGTNQGTRSLSIVSIDGHTTTASPNDYLSTVGMPIFNTIPTGTQSDVGGFERPQDILAVAHNLRENGRPVIFPQKQSIGSNYGLAVASNIDGTYAAPDYSNAPMRTITGTTPLNIGIPGDFFAKTAGWDAVNNRLYVIANYGDNTNRTFSIWMIEHDGSANYRSAAGTNDWINWNDTEIMTEAHTNATLALGRTRTIPATTGTFDTYPKMYMSLQVDDTNQVNGHPTLYLYDQGANVILRLQNNGAVAATDGSDWNYEIICGTFTNTAPVSRTNGIGAAAVLDLGGEAFGATTTSLQGSAGAFKLYGDYLYGLTQYSLFRVNKNTGEAVYLLGQIEDNGAPNFGNSI